MDNPYLGSTLAKHVGDAEGFMSVHDVDGTTASYNEKPAESELAAREETYDIARQAGGLLFSTLRATEMCMSESFLKNSPGIGRLPPLCSYKGGRRVYAPIESLERFMFNNNPDAINSVGVGIAIEKEGAYHLDKAFEQKLYSSLDGIKWREKGLKGLKYVDPDGSLKLEQALAPIESPGNYENGIVDVAPLSYRIQLQYDGRIHLQRPAEGKSAGEIWKEAIKQRFAELRMSNKPGSAWARTVRLVDESNPSLDRFVLYIVPRHGTKEKALSHVVRQLAWVLDRRPEDFFLCIAGDTMTDLWAGIYGANGVPGVFALAGGSRLTDYLIGSKKGQPFAGEWLTSVSRRLVPNGRKGFYYVQLPCMACRRMVVILDEAFPGTTDAASVASFYKYIHSRSGGL